MTRDSPFSMPITPTKPPEDLPSPAACLPAPSGMRHIGGATKSSKVLWDECLVAADAQGERGRANNDQQHRSRTVQDIVGGSTSTPSGQSRQHQVRLSCITAWGMEDTQVLLECALAQRSPGALGLVGAGSGLPAPQLPALALREQNKAQQDAYLWAGSRETLS